MNILLIGNGFDLAHKLQTQYSHFLDFISLRKTFVKSPDYEKDEKYNYIDRICINDNLWINYYEKNKNKIGENWIDFESEISTVIKVLDIVARLKRNDYPLKNIFLEHGELFNRDFNSLFCNPSGFDLNSLSKCLVKELDIMTRAFEEYLENEVMGDNNIEPLSFVAELKVNKLISFNYTNTYQKLYDKKEKVDYNYIHGKAFNVKKYKDIEPTIGSNVVLGIDEFLSEEQSEILPSLIMFKKYYQRIQKDTDRNYRKWLEDIAEQHEEYESKKRNYKKIKRAIWFCKKFDKLRVRRTHKYYHNLYIIGHSLDITDKDVLRTLIVNDNVRTHIYYHNDDAHKRLIANLVKIIGQEEVIKRTAGKNQTIYFLQQNS